MLIDWTRDFDRQLDRMQADATEEGIRRLSLLTAMLARLMRMTTAPTVETPTLKRVRQRRRHEVWRMSHPYEPGIALRLICWFPDGDERVVVALFAADKARMGDVFYDSVGTRADQMIERWLNEREADQE